MSRIFFLTFLMVFSSFISYSQRLDIKLSTTSKKAEKYFYSAYDAYNTHNTIKALQDVGKAIEIDPLFFEAYWLQGDILADDQKLVEAAQSYKKVIGINPEISPNIYIILGGLEMKLGRYAAAKESFVRYLSYDNLPDLKREWARNEITCCNFGIYALEHPVPFQPVNLEDSINTPYDEFVNAITSDEEFLYFTRTNPRDNETLNRGNKFEEDFYISERKGSDWRKALNIGPPINTHGNEGALSISPDGRMIFFAGCNRDDGYGSCDIYCSRKMGDHWSEPENLGPVVNSETWDSQPSFSSDGKTLYFASKRYGGKGSSDIWKTILQPDGSWSIPVNLGDSINTKLEEMAPFIHPGDQTLYFSSRGHLGLGGMDLFYSRKDSLGQWHKPSNLGYPINTNADEITIIVNAKGSMAYISSNNLGGKGKQDIYTFRLYKEAQPNPATYFKGIVYDNTSKIKLEAKFELIDLSTAGTVAVSKSDPVNGEFLLVLPTDRNYALNVSREGYLFYSDNFSLSGVNSQSSPFLKNIPLKPIKIGESVILKNIFFDTDKFSLKDESLVELRKLLAMLQKNPRIKVEISGHTDNVGTAEYNLTLSKNRAKSVYEFLIQQHIGSERLTYAGYGLTRPVDSNETELGRANNRRTEFKVTGY